MIKLTKLLELAEAFYSKAMRSLAAPEAPSLFHEADNFDVKDEELFDQFQLFMNAYQELMDNIGFNPKNLTEDSIETAIQANDALSRRYEKIMGNLYLNMNSEEGWGEDFDPGEFTEFIQKVSRDAEEKLKKAVGKDVDISEATAAQWANQLNQAGEQAAQRGESKQEEWSAKKIQYMMEYRKERFQRMMDAKRIGKGHPDYPKFESYMISRHKSYTKIMGDPTLKAEYIEKAKKRQAVWRNKVALRKQELMALINRTQDPKRLAELQTELARIEQEAIKREQKGVEKATKVREKKEAGTLESYIIHLQQKLASLKSETAKSVKEKAKSDPFFTSYKQAVQDAKNRMDRETSPLNQSLLEEAVKAEATALANYLNNDSTVKKVKDDLVTLYAFRDAVKVLQSSESAPDPTYVTAVLQEGRRLFSIYQRIYNRIANTIQEINKRLETLQGAP